MLDYDLRQKLIEVAKSKGTISYLELRPDAPQTLAAPLDEINKYEQGEGRPLLSAVVVHKEGDGMPGVGFFTIAWELGQYGGGEADQDWKQELKRVWGYWQGRIHQPKPSSIPLFKQFPSLRRQPHTELFPAILPRSQSTLPHDKRSIIGHSLKHLPYQIA